MPFEKLPTLKVAIYGFLIVLIYLIFSPSIFGPITNSVTVGGDQHFIINPILRYLQEWDSYSDPVTRIWFSEFDIHNNPHFNSRYPFFFLWLGEPGGYMDVSHRAFLIAHFHHVIAGLGAFVLALSLRLNVVAAFAAGLFFAFCLNNTYLSPFYWRLAATSWIPWALAGVWLVSSGRNWKLGILIGAPAVALIVFAKCAQPLLYFVIIAIFVGLAGAFTSYRENLTMKKFMMRSAFPSVSLVIVALMLALPVFLPVFTGQAEYVRWTSMGAVEGSYKVPFHATLEMAYPLQGIANILVPLREMPTIGSTFIGPIVGILVFTVFKAKKLQVLSLLMLILALYFVVNGFGELTFIPKITYQLPMINNIRELPSHYLLVNLAVTILLAISWDHLYQLKKKSLQFFKVVGVVFSVLTLACIILLPDVLEGRSFIYKFVLIATPLMLFFGGAEKTFSREFLLAVMAIMVVIPNAHIREKRVFDATDSRLYQHQVSKDVRTAWEWIADEKPNAIVAAEMISYLKEKGPYVNSNRAASLAMYYGLRPFNSSMSPRPYAEFKHFKKLAKKTSSLSNRGLEYFISNNDVKDFNDGFLELVHSVGTIEIYKVKEPVERIKPACILRSKKTVCVRNLSLKKKMETNTSFKYELDLDKKTNIAFFAFKNDNWIYKQNGQTLPILWKDDHAIVSLPPGVHEIEYLYKIKNLKFYWSVFSFGIIIYLFLLLFCAYRFFLSGRNLAHV